MDSKEKKEIKTLQQYLKDNGIDIEDCHKETGIPTSSLYRVWKGNNKPSYEHGKILEAYTNGEVSW